MRTRCSRPERHAREWNATALTIPSGLDTNRHLRLRARRERLVLKVHVKVVRKLIRIQYEEDKAAALEGRRPKPIGLRALYVSSRVRRITEQALGEFLCST